MPVIISRRLPEVARPLVLLRYRTGRGLENLAAGLAKELPGLVAPSLTFSERERHEVWVATEDITVHCVEGTEADVNAEDLEIIVWAHDFLERKVNLEERKDAIVDGVRKFLQDHSHDVPGYVSGFVWILLQPTAFGQL